MAIQKLMIEADVDLDELPRDKLLTLTGYLKLSANGDVQIYNLQIEWNPKPVCDHLYAIEYEGDAAYGRCVKCGKNNFPE